MTLDKASLDYLFALPAIPVRGAGCDKSIPAAVDFISLNGDWGEFGVWKGYSAKILLGHLPKASKLFLFDSFEGLPEDWKCGDTTYGERVKGYFKLEEIPAFNDERVGVIKGLFSSTIPDFVKKHQEPLSLIHIDCDIYSATVDILKFLSPLIVPGTILIFDEYYGYGGECWRQHEYKAFQEFVAETNRRFEYLGRTSMFQVWLKIVPLW